MAKKLSVSQIKSKIKAAYPGYKISWDTSSFKNVRSRCKFTIQGKSFFAIVEHVVRGAVKFRGLNRNIQTTTEEQVLKKIIDRTKSKHPEIEIELEIDNNSYVHPRVKCEFILNKKIIIKDLPFNLMRYGISLKILGIKKSAPPFKRDPSDILKKIQEGWEGRGNKYPARPYISFNPNDYISARTNVIFTDAQYGEWTAHPYHILHGGNHPKRSKAKVIKEMSFTAEEIQERILKGTTTKKGEKILGRNYLTIVPENYTIAKVPCKFIDSLHGEFSCQPLRVIAGQEHPKRSAAKSKYEREIEAWLESLNISCERNKKFTHNKQTKEIDVFIHNTNVGVDYHGLYWHCELNRENDNHFKRREFFSKQGIFLFQILENEWRDRKEVVKSLILKQIKHKSIKTLHADKLSMHPVPTKQAEEFTLTHSLKTPHKKAQYVGLYLKDKLISLMSRQNSKIHYVIDHKNFMVTNCMTKFMKSVSKHLTITLDLRYDSMLPLIDQGFSVVSIKKSFHWTDHKQIYPKNYTTKDKSKDLDLHRIFDSGLAILSI